MSYKSYKNVLLAIISVLAIVSLTVRAQDQVMVESVSETPLAYDVDVVVYGATSGGLPAAAAAAREGKSVLLVEHLPFLGGLLGGGFNMHQDVPFRETLGGITGWWWDHVSKHSKKHNRVEGNRDLAREMLSPYADKIQILTEYRVRSVTMDGDRIVSILLENA
ncbi:MAG: FAD-dependent oxidoreductase, partial [Planctomycetaceae bacterium]|nr:FAD-dependent oxidoreductase [Planctomycetaceae bacterium]